MSPVRAVRSCLRQYAGFSGRAPRSEYWWWCLFWLLACVVVELVLYLPYAAMSDSVVLPVNVPWYAFLVVSFLPSLSVTVRRLHDRDWSGWWVAVLLLLPSLSVVWKHWPQVFDLWGADLFGFVFLALFLLVVVRIFLRGTEGANRFGPDPLRCDFPPDGSVSSVTPPANGSQKPTVREGLQDGSR